MRATWLSLEVRKTVYSSEQTQCLEPAGPFTAETFYLELRASNPLNAAIVLTDLKVQTSVGGDPNESEEGGVIIDAPPEVHLSPLESLQVGQAFLCPPFHRLRHRSALALHPSPDNAKDRLHVHRNNLSLQPTHSLHRKSYQAGQAIECDAGAKASANLCPRYFAEG